MKDGVVAVTDFMLGAEAEVAYNNTLRLVTNLAPSPGESTAVTLGRITGDVITTVQGAAEGGGGAAVVGGGTAVCLTGVGCLATPVAAVAGATAVVHGSGVLVSSARGLGENLATMASTGSGSSQTQWQFLNNRKANQAVRRGWGNTDIQDALDNSVETKSTTNHANGNSATAYYRADGHYVVQDDVTGDIFHFSDTNDSNWFDPFGNVITPRGN